jgi:NAD(P)-dependent dehydrogenase (short-subunit alcohol dehydrogenase family)
MADALIWGASGGIGGALAQLLKVRGWRVFAAARQESKIPPGMDATFGFVANDPFSFDAVAMAVAQQADDLALVVYAAGAMQAKTIADSSPDDWRSVMDVNLNGAYLAAKASIHLLRDGGHFIVVGAKVDTITLPRFAAYAAAKAALEPMMMVMAKEHRKLKFAVVRPGAVDTPFWGNVPFKLPPNAATAASIAEAIVKTHESGGVGVIDL